MPVINLVLPLRKPWSLQKDRLMQFLMHLNEKYETTTGQILLLDPLPTVKWAYSMIQRVKKNVTGNISANSRLLQMS